MYTIKKDKTDVEVDVVISNEEWEKAMEETYQKCKSKYEIPGFRKGHAPRKAIEQEYGDRVFYDQTFDDFANSVLDQIVSKDTAMQPVAQPAVEIESYSASEGTKFKIKYQIIPDFELPQYTNLTAIVHNDLERLDKSVQNEINRHLRDHSQLVKVDRPAADGDTVVIDFIGFINNEEFEGGSAQNYSLEIGSHRFVDNFEEQLIGAKAGETVDVTVQFPDRFDPRFSGQEASFKVTLHEVQERRLPTLDDKFISDTTEFETVEEYKKDVEKRMHDTLSNYMKVEFRNNILKKIYDKTEVLIPESMIEGSVEQTMQYYEQVAAMYGMSLSDYLSEAHQTTLSDFRDRVHKSAYDNVKHRYVMRKIVKEQNITCSEEELAESLKKIDKEDKDELHQRHEAESLVLLEKLNQFLEANNSRKIVPDHEGDCDCCCDED